MATAHRGRRTNVQPSLSPFVGRRRELATLSNLVDEHRLVTVLGPPGVGKTRLARHYAEQRLAARTDRYAIWFCELGGATTELDAHLRVARMLEVPLSGASIEERQRELARMLDAGGPALYLLDNFEQLAPHASETLGAWIALTSQARFVVTSRERLRLPGERLFDLEPLSTREALELFEERARALRSDFVLAEHQAAVERLVTRLDRLPLAIELAAARMRLLDPRELLDDEGLGAIGGVSSTGGERTTTLWQAIEASWQLLPDEERALLAQCAVFRGGFDRAAAEGVLVLGDGMPLLDRLQALRDKSLLVVSAPHDVQRQTRFDLLAIVQEFADAKLAASGLVEEVRARHRRHYLESAERWADEIETSSSLRARELLLVELDNLMAIHRRAIERGDAVSALRAAASLNPVLQIHGPAEGRERVLQKALDLGHRGDPGLRALVTGGLAHTLHVLGRADESVQTFRSAIALAEESGDVKMLGRLRGRFAGVLIEQSRFSEAAAIGEQALACHRQAADHGWEGSTSSNLAVVKLMQGDVDAAHALQSEALRLHRLAGDRRREAIDRNNLASIEQDRGDFGSARTHYEKALALVRDAADPAFEAGILCSLIVLDLAENALEDAEERLEEALALAERVGHRYMEGILLAHRGMLLEQRGDPQRALAAYDEALELLGGASAGLVSVMLFGSRAALLAARGSANAAERALARAEELAVGQGEDVAATLAVCRAEVRLRIAAGSPDAAREELAAARATLARRRSIHLRLAVDRLERALGQSDAAREGRVLEVGADGAWFRWAEGERVSLHRRAALRRLLEAFVQTHARAPGEPLAVEELAARGWPGERIQREAAQSRVHNALTTLRRAGLREALSRYEGGYRLEPAIAVVRR